MKKALAFLLALVMVFALGSVAFADWAPDGPVNVIVAYKAGNGTDQTARILAKYAEKYVGQTLVIDNVDGGSGSIGWSKLADADPDGMLHRQGARHLHHRRLRRDLQSRDGDVHRGRSRR